MGKYVGKFILIFLITIIIGGAVAGGAVLTAVMGMWGNTDGIDLDSLTMDSNSNIVYLDPNTGEEKNLLTLSSDENRIWVDLDATPKNLQNAFIAIEDERFPIHNGVDIKRTLKATLTYFLDKLTGKGGQASLGGSTITQQLIKNITGDDEQTISRKISEISKAIDLEKKLSKDQILELYLNCIFLSQNCHGVQTAANLYFDKDVSQLNLA
ncbi:transglycosylase domain-containing protein, partial [Monoglobus pectinilyticus]